MDQVIINWLMAGFGGLIGFLLNAVWQAVKDLQRAKAYPAIGDQLDAMWKGGEESAAMFDAIMAIKTQFPKPA